jgi:hypothetical protein
VLDVAGGRKDTDWRLEITSLAHATMRQKKKAVGDSHCRWPYGRGIDAFSSQMSVFTRHRLPCAGRPCCVSLTATVHHTQTNGRPRHVSFSNPFSVLKVDANA